MPIPTRRYFCATCAAALLLGLANSARADEAKGALDPNQSYQAERTEPVTYDVDYSVVITAPYHTKLLKVWLPLPQSDQGQEVSASEISTFPAKVTPKIGVEKKFGNKFAYFEFDHPEGAQIIRHKFRIKVWELRWNLDAARVKAVDEWPAGFERYLRGDSTVVVNDRLNKVLKDILPRRGNPSRDLAAVMDWINQTIVYDHANCSLQASSEHALDKRRGHCSDYHGLCAAFGRALGYPTRVTYGINAFPKNSPSHCKIEVYLPPYGWVSFDVSETQKLISDLKKDAKVPAAKKKVLIEAANKRLRSGFRDNTWYLQTRGTDYELVPPASKKVPVVRTIYAEADGVALPDPDPANPNKKEFAWMISQRFTADKKVTYPFKEWRSLLPPKSGDEKP